MTCPLCELAQITRRYFEDDVVVVCDCLSCRVPMLIFRQHGPRSGDEHRHADGVVQALGMRVVRRKVRRVRSHEHWHLEEKISPKSVCFSGV